MKKHDLIKAIGITFLIYVVLSWIIPGGSFSSGVFTKGTTTPLGIADLFLYPIATTAYQMFVLNGVIVVLIGGFYGILAKTGVFAKIVKGLSKKYNGKGKTFVILSTIIFALLSACTNLTLALFLVMPLVIAVIMSLGFDKVTAFLATFVATIVGSIGTIVGYNMDGYNYVNYFFGVELKSTIVYSLVIFALSVGTLLFFVIKRMGKNVKPKKKETKKLIKKEDKEETVKELAPLYEEVILKKKATAGVIVFAILMLVVLVSMFNWSAVFNIKFFDNIYASITAFEVNGYTIFKNLMGSLSAFGYWGNYELSMLIVMAGLLIAWIYKLSVKETVDAFAKGAKEMLPVALVVILSSILLYTINSSSTPFYQSIVNLLVGISSKFNYFVIAGVSAVGSVIYNSFPYLLYAIYDPMTSLYSDSLPIITVTIQAIWGIVSLIVPTSIMLVAGLKFLGISYKEWLKEAWKLIVALLVIISIAILIIATII